LSSYVLVGLGNPGEKYSQNRHNMGFLVVDSIAQAYNFPAFKVKHSALVTEGMIKNKKILLCKPATYINLSGQPVGDLTRFYKIAPEFIYVIHDDLDLPLGKVKLKQGGGSGGHNGLKSLDQHIGKDYWRVRLGIGHPGKPDPDSTGQKDRVCSYVLENFSAGERKQVQHISQAIIHEIADLFGCQPSVWLTNIARQLHM
jgi:PTH1 family peptidyl-tRNA hydrolase